GRRPRRSAPTELRRAVSHADHGRGPQRTMAQKARAVAPAESGGGAEFLLRSPGLADGRARHLGDRVSASVAGRRSREGVGEGKLARAAARGARRARPRPLRGALRGAGGAGVSTPPRRPHAGPVPAFVHRRASALALARAARASSYRARVPSGADRPSRSVTGGPAVAGSPCACRGSDARTAGSGRRTSR